MKKSRLKRKTELKADPEKVREWKQRSRSRLKRSRINPVNEERREREFQRAYGGEERVEWVRGLPSVVSGERPCVNAHVKAGGMGMKADAKWVVPLTQEEHDELHNDGQQTFEDRHDVDLLEEARRIAEAWQKKTR